MSEINYKALYMDILNDTYPEKKYLCCKILNKESLSILDILELNSLIFEKSSTDNKRINKQLRSYSKKSILNILDYQKKNNLNNNQLANHFGLSRNTVTKWKRMFI